MNHFFTVPHNWYASFFTAPINAFWEALVPENVTQQEIGFVERHLQLKPGDRVLDVPCGAGRHSRLLARRGFCVTGIDLSEDAVARARAAATKEELSLTILQQSMDNLRLEEQFDGAICMGNSFGYLSHADTLSFLVSLYDRLLPDARLIIDSGMAAESLLVDFKHKEKYEVEDFVFTIANDYDTADSRLLTHTVLSRGTCEWRQSFSQGLYTGGELTRMLAHCGFAIVGRYANTDDAPYALGQPRLLLVAARR